MIDDLLDFVAEFVVQGFFDLLSGKFSRKAAIALFVIFLVILAGVVVYYSIS